MKRLVALALLIPQLLFAYPMTPDKSTSPGELCTDDNGDFVEYRYEEQIPYCERNVSTARKKKIYEAYGIPVSERKQYTIDHIVPLSIGGDNADENLWPEHKEVKALRPQLEDQLYRALRDGEKTQAEAVEIVLEAKFHPSQRPAGIRVSSPR